MVINTETLNWTVQRMRDFRAFSHKWEVFIKVLPSRHISMQKRGVVGACLLAIDNLMEIHRLMEMVNLRYELARNTLKLLAKHYCN